MRNRGQRSWTSGLTCTCLLVGVLAPQAHGASIEQRLQRLETLVESQGLVDMYVRLEELQKELQRLRGELEEQAHGIDTLKQRQRELYLDIDRRLSQAERGAPTAATQPPAPAAEGPGVPAESAAQEEAQYREAFELLKDGRYAEAIDRFGAFQKQYPASAYGDNAQYWLGEAHYVTREFNKAIEAFQNVIDAHPDSPKVADAMLKIGYCYYELKDLAQAQRHLEELQQRYPGTTAARLAGNRLQKIKRERK